MQIYKTYKFRLYPTDKQQEKLNTFLGTKRFIYNNYLNKKEKNSKLTLKEMKQDLVLLQVEYPWLREVDGSILRTSLDDLDNAFTRFYKKMSGYPKYKKYIGKQSYRTPCIRGSYKEKNYQNIKIAAAQAADELLGIQGVDASFVIYTFEDTVNISARSLGSVNVQILMEKLGGGGSMTIAGAQITDSNDEEVIEKLKQAIKEYKETK